MADGKRLLAAPSAVQNTVMIQSFSSKFAVQITVYEIVRLYEAEKWGEGEMVGELSFSGVMCH